MTDIVIVTYFRKEFTERMLDHIRARTTPGTYRLIVVDNGSTDGTVEMLEKSLDKEAGDLLLALPENIGLQAAKNVALAEVKTDRYVDSDNDLLCPAFPDGPEWLARLNGLMDRNPEFAAISLRCQILVGVGPIFRDAPEVKENSVCGGVLRLMDTAAVREVGGWMNTFENRREEWTICNKLWKSGRKCGIAKELFAYHMFGPPTEGNNRWGYGDGIPHYHGSDTTQYHDEMFKVDPLTLEPKPRHNE